MIIQNLEKKLLREKALPEIQIGSTVDMSIRIKEGSKERIQAFQGVVLKLQGRGNQKTVTIRKMSSGIGVEKTVCLSSPFLENIKIVSRAKVRRARLFYIRDLKGRSSRLKAIDQNTYNKKN